MNFIVNILFTFVLLVVLTLSVFLVHFIASLLEKVVPPRYLRYTIILILLSLMAASTYIISILQDWTFLDTAFVTSLCYFSLGWITNITKRTGVNQAGTIAKFITNNNFKYEYTSASTYQVSAFFLSSLAFLIISWSSAFILYYWLS